MTREEAEVIKILSKSHYWLMRGNPRPCKEKNEQGEVIPCKGNPSFLDTSEGARKVADRILTAINNRLDADITWLGTENE